jgi:hypothetical protein
MNMNETPKDKKGWRILRRFLIGLAIFATLIAIFYTEENWRGKRAWEQCKRELEAKGAVLDWEKYIPPPVPDDQNFFKAPNMTLWFVRGQGETNLSKALQNTNTHAVITNETAAKDYLAWSDSFQSEFGQVREALKRPGGRIESDYSRPFFHLIPNFVMIRSFEQVLAQRAKCYLLLGQPDKALQEVTLMLDMCRILERPPAGKPILLVDAMIDVAISGLYASTVADGLQRHAWQEPQLAALQEQLKNVNVVPLVLEAIRTEPAAVCRAVEIAPFPKLFSLGSRKINWSLLPIPRGWVYQNMVHLAVLEQKPLSGFDLANNTVSPRLFDEASRDINRFIARKSPSFRGLAAIAIPDYVKATLTLARNQTMVNEAQIACALERYHLAHGEYPESLDALVPQFTEKLPHDIISGPPSPGSGAASQPLHYRRTADGNFLLYSIGWNETDDGGEVALSKDGSEDREKGDWVWNN